MVLLCVIGAKQLFFLPFFEEKVCTYTKMSQLSFHMFATPIHVYTTSWNENLILFQDQIIFN